MKKQNSSLVHIRYCDHSLSSIDASPDLKRLESECVGWLTKETADLVHIVYDRCALTFGKSQRIHPRGRGLAIFKEDILEIRKIDL